MADRMALMHSCDFRQSRRMTLHSRPSWTATTAKI